MPQAGKQLEGTRVGMQEYTRLLLCYEDALKVPLQEWCKHCWDPLGGAGAVDVQVHVTVACRLKLCQTDVAPAL